MASIGGVVPFVIRQESTAKIGMVVPYVVAGRPALQDDAGDRRRPGPAVQPEVRVYVRVMQGVHDGAEGWRLEVEIILPSWMQ